MATDQNGYPANADPNAIGIRGFQVPGVPNVTPVVLPKDIDGTPLTPDDRTPLTPDTAVVSQ